jgi:hypothetical protein
MKELNQFELENVAGGGWWESTKKTWNDFWGAVGETIDSAYHSANPNDNV